MKKNSQKNVLQKKNVMNYIEWTKKIIWKLKQMIVDELSQLKTKYIIIKKMRII